MTAPSISAIVIPAYNEVGRIGPTLERLMATLEPQPLTWEILVADDGSADDTAAIVGASGAREPRIGVPHLPHRGKGATVRDGLLAVSGARRFLCDADLAMPPDQIARFLAVVPSQCDIGIGKREGPGPTRIGEPLHRHLLGRAFNTMVRAMVLPGIQDTQCGFKMFTAAAAEAVLPMTAIEGWSFDVELLACARAQGWRIQRSADRVALRAGLGLRVLPHSLEMLRDTGACAPTSAAAPSPAGRPRRPANPPASPAGIGPRPHPRVPASNRPCDCCSPPAGPVTVGAQARPARLTPESVGSLVQAWSYDTRESTEPVPPWRRKPAFEATPVYADGRLFLSTPGGLVIALDAETGAEAWRVDLAVDRGLNYGDFANRGVTVAGDRLYAGTADARLACLGAPTAGRATGSAPRPDRLDRGLRRAPKWKGEWTLTSPPVV